MKVRFGVALGGSTSPGGLAEIVDTLESSGVDSLWFPELVYSPAVDPTVGMAFAIARTTRLKVGTSVAILPGRHPVLVAKQLASLSALAPKRILPVFGLRAAQPAERRLFPAPEGRRAELFDESLSLLRAALTGTDVSFHGDHFDLDFRLDTGPVAPIDVWLGGSAPAALRRVGTYGDGWLGSFLTPAEAGRARQSIIAAATEAGRAIEPDHFGITVLFAEGGVPPQVGDLIRRQRPDCDPGDLIADSWPALHRLLDGYIEAGLTKFVISTVGSVPTRHFIDNFVTELLPRQN
ncbi:LLM class F420-dependent oxidoreductase [Mycobacterium sp. Root265]|uniref:TIGR03854 family LLM class F420-dependent oxidoreductase n=1 Tax=Mycobacterium sp. Root265 TaxID=1736504 RepID=UPI0007104164|nr:TIGR03854 family LLM class F420-dependent oxidoreductase [Mycobacterium sp. Root265]KRD07939.1 LLM class F420-dependent oxidoreductase [Mycobacterium sp. Root265]